MRKHHRKKLVDERKMLTLEVNWYEKYERVKKKKKRNRLRVSAPP